MTGNGTLLDVRDLSISSAPPRRRLHFRPARRVGEIPLVCGVDLQIEAGRTLALVGASGSGKTLTALSLIGLLPSSVRPSGSVRWQGRNLLDCGAAEMRAIRGAGIGFIPQDPLAALNPFMRVDRQVAEAVRAHAPALPGEEALRRARGLLGRTGLTPAAVEHAAHPWEWSGGMRQRALIAMAMAHSPALLIADEPTSALDATTQRDIIALLRTMQREAGSAVLLITHDIAVVADWADTVAVMYGGRIVEAGSTRSMLEAPRQRATALLVQALQDEPVPAPLTAPAHTREVVLRAEGVSVLYPSRRGRPRFPAVKDISFDVGRGETLCIVGESGAGKSSLARALVRIEPAAHGRIIMEGRDLMQLRGAALRTARASIQIVFQNPWTSLNPRRIVGRTIAEPLRIHGRLSSRRIVGRVVELLEHVGLSAAYASRLPAELSGGERQRIAIARAIAIEPRMLVLDEPVSSLDAETRGAILDLLRQIQNASGMAYVLIAHDLRFVRRIAHRVAVMHGGRFVEMGSTDEVFDRPRHACTKALLAAVPGITAA